MHLATRLETRVSFIHKDELVTVLANTQKCPGTVTMRLNIQMSIMAIFPFCKLSHRQILSLRLCQRHPLHENTVSPFRGSFTSLT